MSTPLAVIDLSGASVGTTGKIDLSTCAPTSNPAFTNKHATLVLYNESGAGLRLSGKNTGLSFDLPAGAWIPQAVPAGETEIDYVVLYVLSSAPVTKLLATYYQPGEPVTGAVLGNSPIGLSTNVPLNATATAIANDGNPAGTEFIEASIGGVKHRSDTNSGDISLRKDTTSGNQGMIQLLDLKVGGSNYNLFLMSDGTLMWQEAVNGAFGLRLAPNGGYTSDAGKIATDGAGNLTTKSYKGSSGGTWKARNVFSGTGGGTFAHGLGAIPTHVSINDTSATPTGASAGSYDATNVVVGIAMGHTWTAEAMA